MWCVLSPCPGCKNITLSIEVSNYIRAIQLGKKKKQRQYGLTLMGDIQQTYAGVDKARHCGTDRYEQVWIRVINRFFYPPHNLLMHWRVSIFLFFAFAFVLALALFCFVLLLFWFCFGLVLFLLGCFFIIICLANLWMPGAVMNKQSAHNCYDRKVKHAPLLADHFL